MLKRHRIVVLCVALVALMSVALVPAALYQFCLFRSIRLQKYDLPQAVFGSPVHEVHFRAKNGNALFGAYIEKPNAKHIVLLHHGQGGNLLTHFGLAKSMVMAGCSVLIYDYEGFGKSPGQPSVTALVDDGEAAWDFLVNEKHINPERIVQCGASLGTGVACATSRIHPPGAVVLISPYTSLRAVSEEHFPLLKLYPDALLPRQQLGCEQFLRENKNIPVLIIHGVQDNIIPVKHAHALSCISPAPITLAIAQNAGHGNMSTLFIARAVEGLVYTSMRRGNDHGSAENRADSRDFEAR